MPRILSFREMMRNDVEWAYQSSTTFIDTTFRKSNKFISDSFKQLKMDWRMRKQNKAEQEIHKTTQAFKWEKDVEKLRKHMPSYEGHSYESLGAGERIPHDALVLVQKSVISFYKHEFDKSLSQLKLAKAVDFKLDNVYLYHYLVGYMRFMKGKFSKSIESYKRAIELIDTPQDDEQSEICKSVEKSIIEIEDKMKHTYEKILEYFNTETVKKETSVVSREELSYCLGVSYFSLSYYQDAIDQFTCAISNMELVKNPDVNTILRLAYYYRGYSYFGIYQFINAIDDFTKCLEFNDQDERVKHLLNISKKSIGEEPNQICIGSPPTVFHYRLLNEEVMDHILGYLRIHSLRTLAMTCKYWKVLSMKNLLDRNTCFIQFEEFIKNPSTALQMANGLSVMEKWLMPKKFEEQLPSLFYQEMASPFFKKFKQKQRETNIVFPKFSCNLGDKSVSYFIGNCKKLYIPCITFTCFSYYYNSFALEKYPTEELFINK